MKAAIGQDGSAAVFKLRWFVVDANGVKVAEGLTNGAARAMRDRLNAASEASAAIARAKGETK